MSGKLIVLEGLDGSGKATQTKNLGEYFEREKIPYKTVTFPDYNSPSSLHVKMYLNGELGGIKDVNAYEASTFFASDRIISYKTKWEKDYKKGTTILADRYTTSNAIYQLAKLPKEEWEDFLAWLWDYEFSRLSLPEPSLVIYLDVEPEISQILMKERYNGDLRKRDIHEEDIEYLHNSRHAAFYAMERLGWVKLSCTKNGVMRGVEEIHRDIVAIVEENNLIDREPYSFGKQLIFDNKISQIMTYYLDSGKASRDGLAEYLNSQMKVIEKSRDSLERSEKELEETMRNIGK